MRLYFLDYLVNIVSFSLLFAGINTLVKPFDNNTVVPLIGFFFWYLGYSLIFEFSVEIAQAASGGVLEQIMLTGRKLASVLTTTVISTMLMEIPFALLLVLISGIFTKGVGGINTAFNVISLGLLLVIFCLTCISLAGVGLLMGAATLAWKRTDSWRGVLQYSFLFFSGIFGNDFSWPAINVISNIIPLTWTIRSLDLVFIQEITPLQYFHSTGFWGLFFVSSASLIIGYVSFTYAQQYTLKAGTFNKF